MKKVKKGIFYAAYLTTVLVTVVLFAGLAKSLFGVEKKVVKKVAREEIYIAPISFNIGQEGF